MKVTPEQFVRLLQSDNFDSVVDLARLTGWAHDDDFSTEANMFMVVQWVADHNITLPEPTIPGTLNGTPATFEVVYRAED